MAEGIRIAHRSLRGVMVTIPVFAKKFPVRSLVEQAAKVCPTCGVYHPVKTIHLWLDGEGSTVISTGVYADLQLAGMPDLEVMGTVADPPPQTIGFGANGPTVTNPHAGRQTIIHYGKG